MYDDARLYETPVLDSYRDLIEKYVVESTYSVPESNYFVRVVTECGLDSEERRLSGVAGITLERTPSVRRLNVSYLDQTICIITLDLVETFLGRPLMIVVENIEADKKFVETVLRFVGNLDPDNLWIEFVHGGGNDIVKVLRSKEGTERVFCLIDGDFISPGLVEPSQHGFQNTVREISNKYGYCLHILSKRAIENYLPDEAIRGYLISKGCSSVESHPYFLFEPMQKDFFNMKKGLDDKSLENPIWQVPAIDELAKRETAVTEGEPVGIRGFGKEIWRAFDYVEDREELCGRDGRGELEDIVRKIVNLI